MDNLKYRGGTPWSEQHDPEGNIKRLDEAITVNDTHVAGDGTDHAVVATLNSFSKLVVADLAVTMTREQNIAGLASAIVAANELRGLLNDHAADGAEHFTGGSASPDTVNFPIVAPIATDLPSLIALVTEMLVAYEAHNDDAVLAAGWAFHNAQQLGNALVSAAPPVTLQDAVVDVNDLQTKFTAHDGSAFSHTVGGIYPTTAAAAAYGDTNRIPITATLVGDDIWVDLLDGGTGVVTFTAAVAGAGFVDFQFSADPQNDAVIRYMVLR